MSERRKTKYFQVHHMYMSAIKKNSVGSKHANGFNHFVLLLSCKFKSNKEVNELIKYIFKMHSKRDKSLFMNIEQCIVSKVCPKNASKIKRK